MFCLRKPIWTAGLLASLAASAAFSQSRPPDKARSERSEVLGGRADGAEVTTNRGDETPAEGADDTPLGVDLRSIHLISHQDLASSDPSAGDTPVVIDSALAAPAALDASLSAYVGKPLSMALLQELAKTVIESWREQDFPIIDVYFPEQNITGGKVQIVVRESVVGEIQVNDVTHTLPDYLRRHVRLAPADRIDRRILEADLDWLNRNPIRQTNLIYESGEADGTTDIVLDTIEERPLTAYAGFANTGVALTGENEWSTGFEWRNPLRTEQTIGYHFGTDLEFETLEAHTLLYRNFLPWRHELRFLGAAVFTDVPSDPSSAIPIDLGGENLQASLDYLIPLPRIGGWRTLRHEFVLGLDYKSTNTDLIFGGLNAVSSASEVFQFRTGYEASWRDKLGYQLVSLSSVWSPGEVLDNNDDANFSSLRQGATADYWYGVAELERGIDLPADYTLVLRGRGHLTDDRLLSTEQILAGGYLTVRGFDENLVRGDSGGILNLEIHTPAFSLGQYVGKDGLDETKAFAFYDAAALDITDPIPGELSAGLQSIGFGFNSKIGDQVHLRAAYGWVLEATGLDFGIPAGRVHFGVTAVY